MVDMPGIVVVVDDDESVREAIGQLLGLAGYRPVSFASAEAFLAADDTPIADCLVVDIHLPGMTGPAMVGALATAGRAMPTVFITGRSDPATRELLRRVGAPRCLMKPFTEADLLDAIRMARRPPGTGAGSGTG